MISRMTIACAALFFTATVSAGGYLDQPPPGDEPVLFAPGIVSDGLANRDMAMTPEGDEIYWSSNLREFGLSVILFSKRSESGWKKPEVAAFSRDHAYIYFEPAISPDGSQFFFVAAEPGGEASDIWIMDREGDDWSTPRRLPPPVNSPGKEYFPSVTRDGTLYFTREGPEAGTESIYRARRSGDGYAEPELLPDAVNSGKSRFNAFVAPGEDYLILPVWGREDSLGSVDYYIVFRNENDEWWEPVNLGPKIDTKSGREYTPYVSPDGKYFFFMATRSPAATDAPEGGYSAADLVRLHGLPENGQSDIYWMDAGFIEALRPQGF